MMSTIRPLTVTGGRVLTGDVPIERELHLVAGRISTDAAPDAVVVDATGLLVMPGLVDVHGDAFERQIMPRPGVSFDLEMALSETDQQLAANGITTAFHGLTWSWEPGLRGTDAARAFLAAHDRMRPTRHIDTRIHLRHEVFNLDCEAELTGWINDRRIDVLAFNDHMSNIAGDSTKPAKLARMVERSGVSTADFKALIDRMASRQLEVAPAIERLAAAARSAHVTLMSHDDPTAGERLRFHGLGCHIAEFPTTVEAAEAALATNDWIVFGAPNVIRGGSHIGCPSAADMIAGGLCTVLASDYYYPSLLAAPFRLADDGIASLGEAWALVSENAAAAVSLADRGQLNPGMRADCVLVECAASGAPRVVATIAAGRIVHCTDVSRIGGARRSAG